MSGLRDGSPGGGAPHDGGGPNAGALVTSVGHDGAGPGAFTLLGPDGLPFTSDRPGTVGGHRHSRIYGRLDCPSALRAIARGGYVAHRVFFADDATARAAGYRPCGVCLREEHVRWRASATG